MNLEALALAVDEQVRVPAAERSTGRLYAVRWTDRPSADPPGDGDAGNCDVADELGRRAPHGPAVGDAVGQTPVGGSATTDLSAAGTGGSDGDDEPPPSCPGAGGRCGPPPADGVVLELLAEGEARTLPQRVRPPEGVRAIALTTGAWAAPMEDRPTRSPSRHPERRRAHLTVVVGPENDRDAVDVTVLRYGDGSPTVLRGGVGLVHQRMVRCWSRRPDAPWAGKRPSAAA